MALSQGFFNVSTSVRMTVVRLKNGDLWVHDPVAPTAECLRLVNELGPVKHIVLATTGDAHAPMNCTDRLLGRATYRSEFS